MPRGVYPKSKEHKRKISETLKKKGIKPPTTFGTRYWLGKKRPPHSEEWKRNMSEIHLKNGHRPRPMKGETHWRWKKDRTQLVKSEKKHLDGRYREWMLAVKERDNWRCKIANPDCKGHLEAHHILNWKFYPKERYKINNGITLCHVHHPRKRIDEERLIPMFRTLVGSN